MVSVSSSSSPYSMTLPIHTAAHPELLTKLDEAIVSVKTLAAKVLEFKQDGSVLRYFELRKEIPRQLATVFDALNKFHESNLQQADAPEMDTITLVTTVRSYMKDGTFWKIVTNAQVQSVLKTLQQYRTILAPSSHDVSETARLLRSALEAAGLRIGRLEAENARLQTEVAALRRSYTSHASIATTIRR